MKSSLRSALVKYLGTVIAVLVPAVVIAQALPSFGDNTVLRASDMRALRDNLDDRIAALESRVGALALTKADVYAVSGTPVTVGDGAAATAFA